MKYKRYRKPHSALVQAELYRQLKNRGYEVDVEYPYPSEMKYKKKDRFDLILHDFENIYVIIEVKCVLENPVCGFTSLTKEEDKSIQIIKYEFHGVPVYKISSYYLIDQAVKELTEFLDETIPLNVDIE